MESIILGTGSYETVKFGNTVSIQGDGGINDGYDGPSYKSLSPRLVTILPYENGLKELSELDKESIEYNKLKNTIEENYIQSYYDTRLSKLNLEELLRLLESKFGRNIILVSKEKLGEEICSRRVFASFMEMETGIYVPEVCVDEKGIIKELKPVSYEKQLRKAIKRKGCNSDENIY
jgi:hypothetical protein